MNRASGVDEFVSAYARAAIQLNASRHCLSYDLACGVEQPGNVVVRIEWDSIEDHEQHVTNSPRFEAFIGEIRPWLGYVVEMRHYAVTQVTSYGSASR